MSDRQSQFKTTASTKANSGWVVQEKVLIHLLTSWAWQCTTNGLNQEQIRARPQFPPYSHTSYLSIAFMGLPPEKRGLEDCVLDDPSPRMPCTVEYSLSWTMEKNMNEQHNQCSIVAKCCLSNTPREEVPTGVGFVIQFRYVAWSNPSHNLTVMSYLFYDAVLPSFFPTPGHTPKTCIMNYILLKS